MQASCLEIGLERGKMNIFQRLDGLQLDNDFVGDEEIESVVASIFSFEPNANCLLARERNPGCPSYC